MSFVGFNCEYAELGKRHIKTWKAHTFGRPLDRSQTVPIAKAKSATRIGHKDRLFLLGETGE
jgi:hypothetical protein